MESPNPQGKKPEAKMRSSETRMVKSMSIGIVTTAVIAALYVGLTVVFAPISYGAIQFRISEILILMCFYNRKYIPAMVIGCIIANIMSPLGWWDIVFGTLGTFISILPMKNHNKLWRSAVWASIVNGIIVGAELTILFEGVPLWMNILTVAGGELVVLLVVGVPLWILLMKNQMLSRMIKNF